MSPKDPITIQIHGPGHKPVTFKTLAPRQAGKSNANLLAKEIKDAIYFLSKNAIKPKNGVYAMDSVLGGQDRGLCQGCGKARSFKLCVTCQKPVCEFCQMMSFHKVEHPAYQVMDPEITLWWIVCRDCWLKEFWRLILIRAIEGVLDKRVMEEIGAWTKKAEKEAREFQVAQEAMSRLEKIYPYLRG